MEEIWKRIHTWLDANAPKGYGQLRPAASAKSVSDAEEAMGQKLPADLKASYLVHDGQFDEPGLIGGEGWCLLSLQEMVEKWQAWSKSQDRGRLPIAWGTMGDYIFLDLRDGEQPDRVMVQRLDSDVPDPMAPSFRSWLEDFANKLDDDEFAYSESEGCVMYADEIDID
jgi:cell wall assembly regulator SMI1